MNKGQIYTGLFEGKRLQTYDDATGDTIFANDCNAKGEPRKGTLTIGRGHTGFDFKAGDIWTDADVSRAFDDDYEKAFGKAFRLFPKFGSMCECRQAVCVDLSFNLGISTLLKFKRTVDAINNQLWDLAADQLKWTDNTKTTLTPMWREEPRRAGLNCQALRLGLWPINLPEALP